MNWKTGVCAFDRVEMAAYILIGSGTPSDNPMTISVEWIDPDPHLPAGLFTSCLTCPIDISVHVVHQEITNQEKLLHSTVGNGNIVVHTGETN